MYNIIRLEFSNFFTFNTYSSTRGHPYKLYVNYNRINVRIHFFACRVVNVWNSLPLNIDDFRSLHCFCSSFVHVHHIRIINDLSTASITQHKTHKTYTMAMAI